MKSLTRFAQSVQFFKIKSSKRYKKQNLPFDISLRLKQVSKLVICLPNEPSEAELACQIIPKLQLSLSPCAITLIYKEESLSPRIKLSNVDVLSYSNDEVSRFNMPKKAFIQKFVHSSFDLVIDLSLPFQFTNVMIAWLCGAPLRVGFYHPDREAFYNFLVRQKNETSLLNSYESLVNYLISFR